MSGEFELAGAMAAGRYNHSARLLPDRRIVVIGGYGNDNAWLDSVEVRDPATEVFGPAGSIATMTTLPDGRVLVEGGVARRDGEVPLTAAELIEPAATAE